MQLMNGPVMRKNYNEFNKVKEDHSCVDNIGINEPILRGSEMKSSHFFHPPNSGPSVSCHEIEHNEMEVRQSYLHTMKELEPSLKCRFAKFSGINFVLQLLACHCSLFNDNKLHNWYVS